MATTNLDQSTRVKPLPPGTRFGFCVNFENLRDDELNLLLYALVLEDHVKVTLSPAALEVTEGTTSVTFEGPLRHKLGGCKPLGAGSVHITLKKMELQGDAATRYRGRKTGQVLEGEALKEDLRRRAERYQNLESATMSALRAMLIYSAEDPRAGKLQYPDYPWFQQDKHSATKTPLRPTL